MALQFAHSQQNPPRPRSLLSLLCQTERSCCCSTLRGAPCFLPSPSELCVSPPHSGQLPRVSTSKLPSTKPGSFQTAWLYYIHLYTGTCQSWLFCSIPLPSLPGEAKVTQPRDFSSDTNLKLSPSLARAQFPPTLLLSMPCTADSPLS